MESDLAGKYERLKKDYFNAENIRQRENTCLKEVANTLGRAISMNPSLKDAFEELGSLLKVEDQLPIEQIENEIVLFRKKLFEVDNHREFGDSNTRINALEEQLFDACRVIKRLIIPIVDGFYPLNGNLKGMADAVHIQCPQDVKKIDFENLLKAFLIYVNGLKKKISEDFHYINHTFLILLDHLKDLEKAMANDLESVQLKNFDQFEARVNSEVGSLMDSFNLYSTIKDIKGVVIAKISNIKKLLSKRKKEETVRNQRVLDNIEKLKKRIKTAEDGAQKISKRAKHFQRVATKDGLTQLYNRNALDKKLHEALSNLNQGGNSFLLVILDVDDFKWINDNFGHVAGDRVLKKVAESLKETFRRNDFIARFGGDEFAVVIEELTEKMALERITKFEENFRKKRFFSSKNGDVKVSISAGIAQATHGDKLEDIIAKADVAMYSLKKIKNDRKNRDKTIAKLKPVV